MLDKKLFELIHTAFARIWAQLNKLIALFSVSYLVNRQLQTFVAQITAAGLEGLLYSSHVVVRVLPLKGAVAALEGALDKAFFAWDGRVRRVPLDAWGRLPRRTVEVRNAHLTLPQFHLTIEGHRLLLNCVTQQAFYRVHIVRRKVLRRNPLDHLLFLSGDHLTQLILACLPSGRIGQSFRLFLLFPNQVYKLKTNVRFLLDLQHRLIFRDYCAFLRH